MQREKKPEGTLLTEQPIMRKHNANLTANARELRKSMTKEERHLWYDFLRNYPVRFYRQKVIGTYIADFYCAKAALIVELDGSQHFTQEGTEYDARRTQFLNGYHCLVLRIPNNMVNENFRGVCEWIDAQVKMRMTTPQSAEADSSPCTGEP